MQFHFKNFKKSFLHSNFPRSFGINPRARALGPFLRLWSTQTFSALGSSMTSFALVIWAYEQSGSALSTALLAFDLTTFAVAFLTLLFGIWICLPVVMIMLPSKGRVPVGIKKSTART